MRVRRLTSLTRSYQTSRRARKLNSSDVSGLNLQFYCLKTRKRREKPEVRGS